MKLKSGEIVLISKATRSDAFEIGKLEALCFGANPPVEDSMYMYGMKTTVDFQLVVKASIQNKIVGASISYPTAAGFWYFDSLFVHPNYQKQGIAQHVRNYAMKHAWMKTMKTLVNKEKPHLVKYYESFGFKKSAVIENYFLDNTAHIVMVK